MSKTIYNQFSKDLLSLYCSVKHPAIEEALIKFAAGQDRDFCMWLKINEKTIVGSIKNQKVFGALTLLCDLRRKIKYGEKVNKGNMVKYFLSSPEMEAYLSAIFAFDSVVKESGSDILLPFADLIDMLTNTIFVRGQPTPEQKQRDEASKSQVATDLKTINTMYLSVDEVKTYERSPTIKQQRRDMLIGLLNRFSSDVASACDNAGLPELANKFKDKILAKPPQYGIMEVMKVTPLSWDQVNIAKAAVDYIWDRYDIRWLNHNHDYIETSFLNKAGVISNEDFFNIRDRYEKQRDPLSMDAEGDYSSMSSGTKLPADSHMNPVYLHMLSVFFHYMQAKMKVI